MPGHNVRHLFNCSKNETDLTYDDLWERPLEVAEFLKLTPEPLKALPSQNTYTLTYTKHTKHNKGTEACGNPWNLVLVGPSTVTTHTADAEPTVATSETLVTVRGLGRDDALDQDQNQSQIINESNKENECNEARKTNDNDENQETTTSNRAKKSILRPRNNHV